MLDDLIATTGGSSINHAWPTSNVSFVFYRKDDKAQKLSLQKPRFFMNPYIIFTKSCWTEYRSSNPDTNIDRESFKELTRSFAAKWKKLSAQEKLPFEKQSAVDKARYQEQMFKTKRLRVKMTVTSKDPLNSFMHLDQHENDAKLKRFREQMEP